MKLDSTLVCCEVIFSKGGIISEYQFGLNLLEKSASDHQIRG